MEKLSVFLDDSVKPAFWHTAWRNGSRMVLRWAGAAGVWEVSQEFESGAEPIYGLMDHDFGVAYRALLADAEARGLL